MRNYGKEKRWWTFESKQEVLFIKILWMLESILNDKFLWKIIYKLHSFFSSGCGGTQRLIRAIGKAKVEWFYLCWYYLILRGVNFWFTTMILYTSQIPSHCNILYYEFFYFLFFIFFFSQAMELILTGGTMTAKEAETAGLVCRVVPNSEVALWLKCSPSFSPCFCLCLSLPVPLFFLLSLFFYFSASFHSYLLWCWWSWSQ